MAFVDIIAKDLRELAEWRRSLGHLDPASIRAADRIDQTIIELAGVADDNYWVRMMIDARWFTIDKFEPRDASAADYLRKLHRGAAFKPSNCDEMLYQLARHIDRDRAVRPIYNKVRGKATQAGLRLVPLRDSGRRPARYYALQTPEGVQVAESDSLFVLEAVLKARLRHVDLPSPG